MRKFASFLSGVIAGAVVGAAAAILLAPYSGSDLQNRIKGRAQDLMDEAKRAAAAQRLELQKQLEAFKRGTSVAAEGKEESVNA